MLSQKLRRLVSFFYPSRCPFCPEIIGIDDPCCKRCQENLSGEAFTDRIKTSDGREFQNISPFRYEGEVRQAIWDFKFYGHADFARQFAKSLAIVLNGAGAKIFDLVTCVPTSKQRKKERGYNQAELLARELAAELRVPFGLALQKVHENKVQHELPKAERALNVKGVYATVDREKIAGKRILLCDDIITTGNTLAECARVLFASGAKNVTSATIAQVPNEFFSEGKPNLGDEQSARRSVGVK